MSAQPHADLFDTPRYDAGSKVASGPSVDAGDDVRGRTGRLRGAVLDQLRKAPRGLTADECACRIKETQLATRPRFSELLTLGQIEDTGERRMNDSGRKATVWRLKK